MKWIELKDGNLVNLENVETICCEPLTCRVLYGLASGYNAAETFETPELAKARMSEIKIMLNYEPTTCN